MNQIIVTGASGFVGRALCSRLVDMNLNVRGTLLVSENPSELVSGVEPTVIEPVGSDTSWGNALAGIDIVIHLAARVHIMRETSSDPLKEFRIVNTLGTERLVREAVMAGVKRFIFMSTIGVNGDNSGDSPYTESSQPKPHNPYSVSKYEAEQALWRLSAETGMEVVIVRAPLVYGPGNPGNFFLLLKFALKGIPLPLSLIRNKRSLIYIGNLVDALAICAIHPNAAGKTYLVSDGEDVSTPDLIRRTATALCIPARLLPLPVFFIRLAGKLTGKSAAVNRLIGSLTVDSSKIRRELGWKPPFNMDDGLQATAQWFKQTCR